jgi:hypothetical protein
MSGTAVYITRCTTHPKSIALKEREHPRAKGCKQYALITEGTKERFITEITKQVTEEYGIDKEALAKWKGLLQSIMSNTDDMEDSMFKRVGGPSRRIAYVGLLIPSFAGVWVLG